MSIGFTFKDVNLRVIGILKKTKSEYFKDIKINDVIKIGGDIFADDHGILIPDVYINNKSCRISSPNLYKRLKFFELIDIDTGNKITPDDIILETEAIQVVAYNRYHNIRPIVSFFKDVVIGDSLKVISKLNDMVNNRAYGEIINVTQNTSCRKSMDSISTHLYDFETKETYAQNNKYDSTPVQSMSFSFDMSTGQFNIIK